MRVTQLAKANILKPGRATLLAWQHKADLDEDTIQKMCQGLTEIAA